MCQCGPEVRLGTFDNTVALPVPECLKEYAANRIAAGLNCDYIDVDRCIVGEIQDLWRRGIRTGGSCCGHNGQAPPGIAVMEDSIATMKELGYQAERGYPHVFIAKTVVNEFQYPEDV